MQNVISGVLAPYNFRESFEAIDQGEFAAFLADHDLGQDGVFCATETKAIADQLGVKDFARFSRDLGVAEWGQDPGSEKTVSVAQLSDLVMKYATSEILSPSDVVPSGVASDQHGAVTVRRWMTQDDLDAFLNDYDLLAENKK